jgi:hypothetical protein
MTSLKSIDLTAAVPPRRRRDWYGWTLRGTWLSYPAYQNGSRYGFDLTGFGSSAAVLDIIMQVGRKPWATKQCVVGLVLWAPRLRRPSAEDEVSP